MERDRIIRSLPAHVNNFHLNLPPRAKREAEGVLVNLAPRA